ncbi:ankyrin repeat-containing protein [Beauveria bassiana ARSEF 2860]|uniref:Ankyrin repeat-containing protein n=1 Tax=Beauveria bassiana (strain ARSEF 2860) TaxID=655819 RepID=J4KLX7_BEAB2|nr:ankyrin repeat-containing protein [Beauveria bassiana ARSEF 2860]EJP62974.1 ankyrin repeat-containing protein [Beauveria bassiana ARSEF 2860]
MLCGLRAKYERQGHSIQEDIRARLVAENRLKKKYSRPAVDTDSLYQSHVIHPQSESSCLDSCGRDAQSVSIRTARDEVEDDPAIHYGLIASANQLMKDAKLRDQYANEKGIFMLRDGSSRHIVPQTYTELWIYDVNAHSEPQSPGYAVSEAIRTTSEVITDIESTVAKDGDDKILNWPTPTPIDYGSQYSDLLKVRQPGTGQWFLDSTQYQTWRTTQKQICSL